MGKDIKKYSKYYLALFSDGARLIRQDSDLPFSISKGKKFLKEKHPGATQIKHKTKTEAIKRCLLLK